MEQKRLRNTGLHESN